MLHLQDDMRSLREHIARAQDDINALRQSRDEAERRGLAVEDVIRQEKNDNARRFGELERHVESWQDRLAQAEEYNRRNLDRASQLGMRIEAIENQIADTDNNHSRTISVLSRHDQELQRLAGAVLALQNEDASQRERIANTAELMRHVQAEIEPLRAETNKISRIDDRLELVQAERTRHNERLNEVSSALSTIENRLNDHDENYALLEARMGGYQDDLRQLRERMQTERERLAAYLNDLRNLQADMRKRQIVGLEKEIRDIRGRAFDVSPD
jgi:chromosome segregation ATPase